MRHVRELALIVFVLSVFPFASAAADTQAVSDSALTAKVKSALTAARGAESRNIKVETRDGVVQLSGFVGSEDARSAALMRARAVAGVAEVRNDLTIRNDDRPTQQQPASDTVIAARVRSNLSNARLDSESDVNVQVSAGVVQLSGFVTSVEEKVRAGDAASAVPGVRDVENNIALTKEHEQRLPPE